MIGTKGRARIRRAWKALLWMTVVGLGLFGVFIYAVIGGFSEAPRWTVQDIPPQDGKTIIVTGGTSGIGLEVATALAGHGADVILAARGSQRAEEAIAAIRREHPAAKVRFEAVDLGDLASVRDFGRRARASMTQVDVLVNNAGLMEPPQREVSKDGYEIQLAVNHLGHFALTAELLPLLAGSENPRVVTVSSIAARQGRIHFDDLQFEGGYDSMAAYSQSKLANLMFALELQRRSDAAGWGLLSVASHPGVSRTNLQINRTDFVGAVRRNLPFLYQPAEQGALATLYAVTSEDVRPGDYFGPSGVAEIRGYPALASIPEAARDQRAAGRLWEVSERMTSARYLLPAGTADESVGVARGR